MKNLLLQIFTWWRGQTLGTRFFTWRHGQRVGEDEFGNIYYRNAEDTRRWVIYNDLVEASFIPPGWHGWMHHKVKTPPSDAAYQKRDWEIAHRPNQTGTASAYRPASSLLHAKPQVAATDYEPWTP